LFKKQLELLHVREQLLSCPTGGNYQLIQAGTGMHFFQGYFMKSKNPLDAVYAASSDIVVREIEDEIILFPYESGTDDTENEPYFLNATGQVIWQKLDGRRSLKDIMANLATEFKTPAAVIKKDATEFVKKLIQRKLLFKVSKT
jgi:hypothetical protein